MQIKITELYQNPPKSYSEEHFALFEEFLGLLNSGKVRSAECVNSTWQVNAWVKMGILLGFRMGVLAAFPNGDSQYFDKSTLPPKAFRLEDNIRIVPGGTSARSGCYIASGVTIMPPAFVNIGAYVDSGSLIDSHALVGSCAQVGKNVHLSAGAMLGGVLEPIGMNPVIIEDNAFIGGNTGIYEGVIIGSRAVIASGTILTASTPVYDSVHGAYLPKQPHGACIIPAGAVVVPGSRNLSGHAGFQLYCPIIVKYRDAKTDISVALEADIRSLID